MIGKLRAKLEENKALAFSVGGGLVLLAIGSLIWMIFFMTEGGSGDHQGPYRGATFWFYDLNTKELYIAPRDSKSPTKAPSDEGKDTMSGVRAYVFSCGECGDESKRFIGYLEKFEKGKVPEGLPPDSKPPIHRKVMIYAKGPWITLPNEGPDSYKDAQAVRDKCGEATETQECFPE